MITIEEVAARVNLNKGSVSRILNGKGEGYSDQTKQRVLQTAAEMGYRPNVLARALWTGSTNTVGLWLLAHDSYSPYYGYIHHCLQSLSRQHNYQLITEDTPLSEISQADVSQPARWPVDGILSCDVTHAAAVQPQSLMGRRCPVVYLGQGDIPDIDYVRVDLYAGAREAVKHVLECGGERIAFVSQHSVPAGTKTGYPRARAYVDVVTEAGKKPEYVTLAAETRLGAYEAMKEYVARSGCPNGLFCADDEIAIGCFLALNELGLKVPDDVSLVGFNGLDEARLFPCPISSIVIPVQEMCVLAWDMLMKRIGDPKAPLQQLTLTPRLEVRASSRSAGRDSI